jgi:hypothetical protein
MPTAPADYQTRYPIDFGDIDPAVGQRVVQLYPADGAKARAICIGRRAAIRAP